MINDGNGSVGHRLLDGVPQWAHHLFLNLSFIFMEILVLKVFVKNFVLNLYLQQPLLHHSLGIDGVDRWCESDYLVLIFLVICQKRKIYFKKKRLNKGQWLEGLSFSFLSFPRSPVRKPSPQCPGCQTCPGGSQGGRCPGKSEPR